MKKELIFVDTNVVVWFLKGRPSVWHVGLPSSMRL